MTVGTVFLVGAGPGDPELLTLKAAKALRAADVVLHDELVSPEILRLIPPTANLINVGKRCGKHSTSQEQINALMVFYARRDATAVVRLKSGDPAIFGRLGEEIECLRHAEIPFEIVPGITAAHASAAAASLTLTDRRSASALVLLTRMEPRASSALSLGGVHSRRTIIELSLAKTWAARVARRKSTVLTLTFVLASGGIMRW